MRQSIERDADAFDVRSWSLMRVGAVVMLVALFGAPPAALAEEWPTYRHDNRRSGVTSEAPRFPLERAWMRESPVPPMTAWSGPAKWDAYSGNKGLQSMRNFDPAFFVTVAGGSVYFGSSVDHALHCLDAGSGGERWVALVGGAVRLPPAIAQGRAYFGADDGFAYCVDCKDGALLWRHRPAPDDRLIPSNGKLISPWPVRTGVLVQETTAFFAASLVPWEKTYLCALDAVTGEVRYAAEEADMTLQGAMLASSETLYAPQGRSVPFSFNIRDGRRLKGIAGTGGTFCLLTEDERLVAMPSNQKSAGDVIQIADPSGREAMLRFAGADRLVAKGGMLYLHQGDVLKAFDRAASVRLETEIHNLTARIKQERGELGSLSKQIPDSPAAERPPLEARAKALHESVRAAQEKIPALRDQLPACVRWQTAAPVPFDLILAGDFLIAGGDGQVAAFDVSDGKLCWRAEVEGRAFGLAFAEGKLFVSTGLGHIYCFGHN